MSEFKKGDKVVYIMHQGPIESLSYIDDLLAFNIGDIYTVKSRSEVGPVLFFEGVSRGAFESQVKLAIPDTKINRVLYPELKPKKGYLV